MPSPEHLFRHQYAVLWRKSSTDNYGQATVGAPEEILVRWDVNWHNPTASQKDVLSKTTTAIVDEKITVGSRMWLGMLQDLPDSPEDVMEVIGYTETFDVKGREVVRVVTLQRYLT